MPVLQFKGKAAIESYHHTVPHHTLDFDGKLLRSEWCLTPISVVDDCLFAFRGEVLMEVYNG